MSQNWILTAGEVTAEAYIICQSRPEHEFATDRYEFNVSDRVDHLSIDEMPSETLSLLGEIQHAEVDRARMKKVKKARDMLNRLSKEERKELLAKLH